jgi:hypothetical protein
MGRLRFDKNQLLVQRSFVSGRVDDVKTEYSQDYVPLHPSLTEILADTKRPESHRTSDKRPRSIPKGESAAFGSPWDGFELLRGERRRALPALSAAFHANQGFEVHWNGKPS